MKHCIIDEKGNEKWIGRDGEGKKLDRSIPLPIHTFSNGFVPPNPGGVLIPVKGKYFDLPEDGIEQMEKNLIKEDRIKALKSEMQKLVSKYGICMVLGALKDEAARMVLCDYCPDAVKIHDVLRATQEELCETHTH